MTNLNWLSAADMSLLDYHTGPQRMVELPCTVADYISNFEVVDWLAAVRFYALEDGPPEVEKRDDFLYHYRTWIVRWRHWAAVLRSLRVTVIADMPWA